MNTKNKSFNKLIMENKQYKEISLFGLINISLIGTTNLNFKNIKKFILTNISKQLFSNIDIIYLYDLKDSETKAYYDSGMIVINLPLIKDDKDFIKTLLHELIHSQLDVIKNSNTIETVIQEYLRKRGKVLNKLLTYNNSDPKFNSNYANLEYDQEFESYLKDKITYQIVYPVSHIYFPSPYAISSIDEYLCIGFEIYLLENKSWLEEFCPELYKLIENTIGGI